MRDALEVPEAGVFVGAVLVISTAPPATNVTPGMDGYTLVLVVLVGVILWLRERPITQEPLSRTESLAIGGLFGWIFSGCLRAGDQWDLAMVAALLAAAAVGCPWAIARRVSRQTLAAAVIWTCGAVVVGSALAAWVVPVLSGQGLALRPGLPIGGASNNSVGLTLALAGTLAGARRWFDHRWMWWSLAASCGLLLVQSVSRAGWVMALVVVVAAVQLHRNWDQRRVAIGAVSVVSVALGTLLLLRGPDLLVDEARWDNTVRGLDAWWSSPGSVLFGHGPQQVWPWLATERDWAAESIGGTVLHDGPWGRLLYHAHSTYLGVLVEHGLVGLGLLLGVLWFVCRRCVREIRQRGDLALVAVAVLLALPAMAVELYLFRSFASALVWWAAVFAVGRGEPGRDRR